MINDAVRGCFGFERLPVNRSIPAGALLASASHQQAASRSRGGGSRRPGRRRCSQRGPSGS